MLYKPQIGPEHRKQIEWYKKVRENIAGISIPKPAISPMPKIEPPPPRRQAWEEIILAASSVLSSENVTIGEVLERRGRPEVVDVRDVSIYVMKEELKLGGAPMSFAEIGKRLDGRNHATILHAWRKIDALMRSDEALRKNVENIRSLFASKKVCART